MLESLRDAELVERARRGEAEAYGELYRRYFDPIFRYLRTRVADEGDAEDLAATVFLRAYQSLGRYRERGWPFSAFLYQIARHALVDHYRRPRDEADLAEAERIGSGERIEDDVGRRETVARIRKALAGLTPDYQEVIRLRLLLDLPTETAAQWMGRSEGALRVLLYRALEALRKRLGEGR